MHVCICQSIKRKLAQLMFSLEISSKFFPNKKLSCRKETARCFVSLNISPMHSRSLKVTGISMIAYASCRRSMVTMGLSCIISETKRNIGRKSLFLPRDAMHKRGLCRHAVSVCLLRSWIMSKRLSISLKKFHRR